MKTDSFIKQVNIIRVEENEGKKIADAVVDENILEIFINEEKKFEMVFSMSSTEDLAAGFLFTQGIVLGKNEIRSINILEKGAQCRIELDDTAAARLQEFSRTRPVKGSSGGLMLNRQMDAEPPARRGDLSITPDQVSRLIHMHWEYSLNFRKTGALHSAALCSPEKTLSYFEDIGRHNAVDKLVGNIFMNEIETGNKIATLSCRMSLEIIGKIIKTTIPVVISNAAPTLGAVRLAEETGLTLIGFARGGSFNIYSHSERVAPV